MATPDLLALRKRAENAVADMTDGPLKIKAFEVILQSLLSVPATVDESDPSSRTSQPIRSITPNSLTERVTLLPDAPFFDEPNSLREIHSTRAEHALTSPHS